MLVLRTVVHRLPTAATNVTAVSQARNMATLREIEMRLKSVKNIEKITKVSGALDVPTVVGLTIRAS